MNNKIIQNNQSNKLNNNPTNQSKDILREVSSNKNQPNNFNNQLTNQTKIFNIINQNISINKLICTF